MAGKIRRGGPARPQSSERLKARGVTPTNCWKVVENLRALAKPTDEAMSAIRDMFEAELNMPTDPGTTTPRTGH